MEQQLLQSDPVLDAFDQLRVREVKAKEYRNVSAFLAKFQSAAASLEPDERIKLVVRTRMSTMELLKAVLADPHASKICSLFFRYYGKEDMTPIVPLLISSCPELASLQVEFRNHSEFDFVSSVLEHPGTKIKALEIPKHAKGDSARFFAALRQSQVSALALYCLPEFAQGLHEYLARDLLVRLKVFMGNRQVPSAMMMSLAKCTRLAELKLTEGNFFQSIAFPKSITKLELDRCWFDRDQDWSFLAGSNVQELDLHDVRGVDGNRLGGALAAHLRARGLDKLRFYFCGFDNEILAAVGVELGQVKKLEIDGRLNDASVELIAFALQSPNNEMKELRLWYTDYTMSSIANHLVPALKHPNCNLVKLSLPTFGGSAKATEVFRNRLALL